MNGWNIVQVAVSHDSSFFRCPDSGGISSSLCLALSVKLPSGERHRILVMIRQEIGAGNGLVSSGTRASPESSSTNLVSSDPFSLPWELCPGIMVVLFRSLEILQRIRASCWSFTCVMPWLRTPYLKHSMVPGSVALVSFSWTPSFPDMGYHCSATRVMTSLKAPFWNSSRTTQMTQMFLLSKVGLFPGRIRTCDIRINRYREYIYIYICQMRRLKWNL